jgi:hypothetical protein
MAKEGNVDITLWAIKNLKSGNLVGNKYSRNLWKVKPTNAINHLQNRYGKRDNRLDLVPVRVRIQEVQEDE